MNGNRAFKFFLIQIVLATFVVVPLPSTAGSPEILWLRTAGNSAMEVSFSLAVDSVGNSYIGGYFNSTNVSFGNGVFITNVVTTASPPWDVFMAKYNPHGEIVWATSFGGSDDDRARAIAVDSQGDCFVTGRFYSTNFSIGGVFLTNSVPRGNSAIFVAKFDGLGNLLWARVPDKGYNQSGSGIAVDSLGNCYVTGSFSGTNTFAGTNLISRGSTDVLLLKYDPLGNLLWAKRAGGNDLDAGAAVAVDGSGNACLLANIRGTNVIFDSFNFSADAGIVDQDIVVAKYETSGAIMWAKQYGGTGRDTGRSIGLDGSGNCYITGDFDSTNLTFASDVLTNSGFLSDAFVAKLANNGDALWGRGAQGDWEDSSSAAAVDFAGNCYIAGFFEGSNLVFGATVLTNFDDSAFGEADAFIGKFTADGDLLWVSQIKGEKDQRALAIGVDSSANAYVTGWTLGTNVLFGTFAATNAYLDIFLTKIESDFPFLQVEVVGTSAVVSWPTNKAGFTLQCSTNLLPSSDWIAVESDRVVSGSRYVVTSPIDSENKFYRLKR